VILRIKNWQEQLVSRATGAVGPTLEPVLFPDFGHARDCGSGEEAGQITLRGYEDGRHTFRRAHPETVSKNCLRRPGRLYEVPCLLHHKGRRYRPRPRRLPAHDSILTRVMVFC
jgi:hypothetical protein